MVIWKFPLSVASRQEVEMPIGARILAFQVQRRPDDIDYEAPTLWAMCDEAAATEIREFRMLGTGHNVAKILDIEKAWNYIGTIQWDVLVWHLFEGIKKPV
jgi:hypothetical protein